MCVVAVLAALCQGTDSTDTGGAASPSPAPPTMAISPTTIDSPSTATPSPTQAPETEAADTAASVVERMECDAKLLSRADMDAQLTAPSWLGDTVSAASCQYKDWTAIVVAEYETPEAALQAIARAQDSQGWHNRVTAHGRFVRGASGADEGEVDFPKINQ